MTDQPLRLPLRLAFLVLDGVHADGTRPVCLQLSILLTRDRYLTGNDDSSDSPIRANFEWSFPYPRRPNVPSGCFHKTLHFNDYETLLSTLVTYNTIFPSTVGDNWRLRVDDNYEPIFQYDSSMGSPVSACADAAAFLIERLNK